MVTRPILDLLCRDLRIRRLLVTTDVATGLAVGLVETPPTRLELSIERNAYSNKVSDLRHLSFRSLNHELAACNGVSDSSGGCVGIAF